MEINLLRKNEQTAAAWAGGTTTQLAIWPPGSDYRERDFVWRLSTARVELEESVFTPLPGYHRLLMILEGSVRLTHQTPDGRREIALDAFGQDSFEGGWKTASRGRCADFNLMMAAGCEGSLEAMKNSGGGTFTLNGGRMENGALVTQAFYCLRPGIFVEAGAWDNAGEKKFETTLGEGDFLMFSASGAGEKFRAVFSGPGGLSEGDSGVWGIRAEIKYLC